LKKIYILLSTMIVFYFACTEFENSEKSNEIQTDYPDQESWEATMFFTKEGRKRAILTAGYIAKYSARRYTLLEENVKVDFFDENGNHKSVMTALEGKVFDDRQDMIATGNVVVVSDNGTTLYSEELHWLNKEEKIVSKVPVKITTKSDTLFGDTFKSDPDLINYEITNARGTSDKTIKINE